MDFKTIGNQASAGDPAAQLYWAALGRLTSTGSGATKTPMEVHDEVVALAKSIFQAEPAAS